MTDTDEPVISVENLSAGYGESTVIRDVGFAVSPGEIFVIMGPSGCGKTTLLKSIVGLLQPSCGDVRYRGESVLEHRAMERFRRSIGMVFQQGALLNSVSLEENVALPLVEHTRLPRWMVDQVVRMKLAQVGLLEARKLLPVELSGGMRKRAGIARALVMEPDLLFFDEPTGGLDPITADGIDNLILALRETLAVTIVAVTHELASIFKIADRIMMLRDGEIEIIGSPEEVKGSSSGEVRRFIERKAMREDGAADRFLDEVGGNEP